MVAGAAGFKEPSWPGRAAGAGVTGTDGGVAGSAGMGVKPPGVLGTLRRVTDGGTVGMGGSPVGGAVAGVAGTGGSALGVVGAGVTGARGGSA